jgi:hypothetical protein
MCRWMAYSGDPILAQALFSVLSTSGSFPTSRRFLALVRGACESSSPLDLGAFGESTGEAPVHRTSRSSRKLARD